MNANFRFVVHPSGDYKANLSQPDVPLPWEHVLQVLTSVESQCNACPICLEQVPTAPRMAKCGHIFCLPCALSYLISEDIKTGRTNGKWRKCPICFDSIYEDDLRPLRWLDADGPAPTRGRDVTLQLIKRKAGTMFALPRDAEEIKSDFVPWHNQDKVLEHCRIIRGDSTYMITQLEREITELAIMKEQDRLSFGDEGVWTAKAIKNIEEAVFIATSLGVAPKRPVPVRSSAIERPPVSYTLSDEAPSALVQNSISAVRRQQPDTAANDAALESASGDAYYFYQPRFGIHYYLAPLDVRILKKAFHSFSRFPSALIAKVEHTMAVTIDEDLRRRSKYLSHLPLGCEIIFLECDWSGVLDDDVIECFQTDTEKRRKKRHDKAVSEEAARRRAQAAEERRERSGLAELMWQDEDTSYFARNDETNTYEVFADDHLPSNSSVHSTSLPKGSPERTSVWGTSVPPPDHADVQVGDDQLKERLEKFYEESAITSSLQEASNGPNKKGKSRKKKLVLMSSGGGRGMG